MTTLPGETPGSQEPVYIFYTNDAGTLLYPVAPSTPLPVTGAVSGTVTATVASVGPTGSAVPASADYVGLIATTSNPTSATAGNLVGLMGDIKGRIVTVPQAPRQLVGQQTTTITASTSETTIVTAISGVFADITAFNFSNTGASATAVSIRDTTSGSILRTFMVPAGDIRGQTYQVPVPQTTVNTNWTAQCGTSTSSLIVTVDYVKNTA